MKIMSPIALGLALAAGGGAALPATAAKPASVDAGKPSSKVLPLAAAIQQAEAKQDWATAAAKLKEAEPLISTDSDRFYIGQFNLALGQGTNDMAATAHGIDLVLASNKADAAGKAHLYAAQGKIAFSAKDYRKAQTSLTEANRLGSDDPQVVPALIQSIAYNGQPVQALDTLNAVIAKMQAAGQPVPREWFGRGYTIAYGVKKTDPNFAAVRSAGNALDKKWLAAEPTGTIWHDALLLYMDSIGTADADLKNDVRRLLLASGGLHGGNDYLEYAETVYLRYPGEAKSVLDAGVKKGVLNLAGNRNATEINQIVAAKVGPDRATLPASDKSARAAASGKAALATADAYYGYGDYAKAVDLYKVALTKGGVDADVVNTRIGASLYHSGDKAGAKAAFAKVTGAQRKDLADFWQVLIDHPTTA